MTNEKLTKLLTQYISEHEIKVSSNVYHKIPVYEMARRKLTCS